MISKELVSAVHIEAAKLKENATKDELARLNFETFDPCNWNQCIYGQATGACKSPRASRLIKQCAPFVLTELENVSCDLPRGRKGSISSNGRCNAWSPIETYIYQKGADNEQLIRYLKGQRKTLNLSPTVNC